MSNYKTLITNIGLSKLADATATGNNLTLTKLAVGDGGGDAVMPDADMSSLVNEVWRGPINSISTDQANPSHLNIECIIPTSVGGWWMREVGIFDAEGDLIIIANYPDTHKTLLEDGAPAEFRMMVIAEFTNADAVTLQIDPAIVMASKDYVDKSIEAIPATDLSGYATTQYVDQSIANIPATDLSGYATTQYVDQSIANIPAVDLSGYATEQYVNDGIASAPYLGSGQSYQNMTNNRSNNINYTNTTARPIYISVNSNSGYGPELELYIDGSLAGFTQLPSSVSGAVHISGIIPSGSTYKIRTDVGIQKWVELR